MCDTSRPPSWFRGIHRAAPGLIVVLLLVLPTVVLAQSESDIAALTRGMNTIWVLITAFLVFFMQAGFAFLEAGYTSEKNTVSILMKNIIDFACGTVVFWAVGYGLMFGTGSGWVGLDTFFLLGLGDRGDIPGLAFWLFQLVFAGTAATIVSGAIAERARFSVYLVMSVIMTGLIYPVFGHWAWADSGWLSTLPLGNGFMDFAGSTVVHSVGGWAALMGAYLLGPRIGRFDSNPAHTRFQGQSVAFTTLGVFILWLGWFGFNPGSQLAVIGDNADAVALVAVNTNIAAATGAIGALLLSRMLAGTWRLTTTLNGVLGGLVAITAPCNVVLPGAAMIIGLVGGVVVTLGTDLLARWRIDDPVGAVPVHLFAGIWGTLAVGLFAQDVGLFAGAGFGQVLAQLVGIVACALWTGAMAFVAFFLLQRASGLRVAPEVELRGLDITEHGETGYNRLVTSEEETPSAKLRHARPS